MAKKIEDLRECLFDALEKLKNGDMNPSTARAICEVGTVIVESAKVEIEFLKVVKDKENTGFIDKVN